jgi:hypothetical protein
LLKDGDGERDYGLKVGDSQKFQFGTTVEGEPAPDPPLAFPKNRLPYLDHSLPRHNVAGADGKVIEGWEGKSKGVRQILFESRQFKKGMVGKLKSVNTETKQDPQGRSLDLCGATVLRQRRDFHTEMSEMERLVTARGHVLVMSPKVSQQLVPTICAAVES